MRKRRTELWDARLSGVRLKLLCFAIGLTLCGALVVGCGGGDSSTSASTTSEEAPAETEEAPSTEESTEGEEETETGGEAPAAVEIPDVSEAELTKTVENIFGTKEIEASSLPTTAQNALKVASVPLTKEQEETVERCLEESPCTIGEGEITIGDLDGNGQAPIRRTARAAMIAQALRFPQIGKIVFVDGEGDLQKFLAGFRSLMTQDVTSIQGTWDFATSLAPLAKQATSQGILVVPTSQEIPGADESEIAFEVTSDVCTYGEDAAKAAIEAGPKSGGAAAIYTGTPGNSFGAIWIPCAKKVLDAAGWTIATEGTTDWTPQGEQQATSALISSGKKVDAILYDYTPTAMIEAYADQGENPPTMVGGAGDASYVRAWEKAEKQFKFAAFLANSQTFNAMVGVTGVVEKTEGGEVPAKINLPNPILPIESVLPQYSPELPDTATFNNNLPLSLQIFAQGG